MPNRTLFASDDLTALMLKVEPQAKNVIQVTKRKSGIGGTNDMILCDDGQIIESAPCRFSAKPQRPSQDQRTNSRVGYTDFEL
jgi:hypothetical protein